VGTDQVSGKIIIAHRGLLEGPDETLQNSPDQVELALAERFDVEIDVWLKGNKWYLGHDFPLHEVTYEWLSRDGLWIHCKNLDAFFSMKRKKTQLNYFFHDSDLVVLTSRGQVWTYYGHRDAASEHSICVMPEVSYAWDEIETLVNTDDWLGFCTDWPRKLKSM
jgi:hypothetical protein